MKYKKIAVKEKQKGTYSISSNSILNNLLLFRNLKSEEEVEKFLNPKREDLLSPYLLVDMEKSVERIKTAIELGQTILVWGDFDCDGVTSTGILYKALKELNANVLTFIPDRLLHGHGLNSKELLRFVSKEKVKLVITVDCATSNISEVNLLKGLGIDTIITDHHATDGDLPNAYAILNPQVPSAIKESVSIEDITSLTYNSGSHIAFKLASALLENSDNQQLKDELLIISACGVVADVVPLVGENRILVSTALNLLNTKKENSCVPVYELLSRNLSDELITSTDIAFVLAPRINAVGRLANAKLSFDFLTSSEPTSCRMIIEQLDNYNKIRQSKCQETYDEIINYLKQHKEEKNNSAVVLINKDWHIGVIGIVASKIVEEFDKPCFLMTVDENNNARCSIRSNDVINVYDVLKENEELFLGFGGHKLAGGCSFDLSKTSFDIVKKNILETVKTMTQGTKIDDTFYADIEIEPNDIELDLIENISQLEPFGQNNETPIFVIRDVILDEFKLMGKEQNHLKMMFSKDGVKFQAVKWNENELYIPHNAKCDIAFYLRENEFNGVVSPQLEILDIFSEEVTQKDKKEFKIYDQRKKTGILSQVASYCSRMGLDIGVYAKLPKTKEVLMKYSEIKSRFIENNIQHDILMLYDYPSTNEEMAEIIEEIKPKEIHFMNHRVDENLENYVKQLSGMIKYCSHKLNGKIDLKRLAQALGVSENFVQIALEMFENINSITILDIDKLEYNKPFNYDEFKLDSMFEILKEEFEKIVSYKKNLLNCDFKEIEKEVEQII